MIPSAVAQNGPQQHTHTWGQPSTRGRSDAALVSKASDAFEVGERARSVLATRHSNREAHRKVIPPRRYGKYPTINTKHRQGRSEANIDATNECGHGAVLATLLEKSQSSEQWLERMSTSHENHQKTFQTLQAAQLKQSAAQMRFLRTMQERQDELQRSLVFSMVKSHACSCEQSKKSEDDDLTSSLRTMHETQRKVEQDIKRIADRQIKDNASATTRALFMSDGFASTPLDAYLLSARARKGQYPTAQVPLATATSKTSNLENSAVPTEDNDVRMLLTKIQQIHTSLRRDRLPATTNADAIATQSVLDNLLRTTESTEAYDVVFLRNQLRRDVRDVMSSIKTEDEAEIAKIVRQKLGLPPDSPPQLKPKRLSESKIKKPGRSTVSKNRISYNNRTVSSRESHVRKASPDMILDREVSERPRRGLRPPVNQPKIKRQQLRNAPIGLSPQRPNRVKDTSVKAKSHHVETNNQRTDNTKHRQIPTKVKIVKPLSRTIDRGRTANVSSRPYDEASIDRISDSSDVGSSDRPLGGKPQTVARDENDVASKKHVPTKVQDEHWQSLINSDVPQTTQVPTENDSSTEMARKAAVGLYVEQQLKSLLQEELLKQLESELTSIVHVPQSIARDADQSNMDLLLESQRNQGTSPLDPRSAVLRQDAALSPFPEELSTRLKVGAMNDAATSPWAGQPRSAEDVALSPFPSNDASTSPLPGQPSSARDVALSPFQLRTYAEQPLRDTAVSPFEVGNISEPMTDITSHESTSKLIQTSPQQSQSTVTHAVGIQAGGNDVAIQYTPPGRNYSSDPSAIEESILSDRHEHSGIDIATSPLNVPFRQPLQSFTQPTLVKPLLESSSSESLDSEGEIPLSSEGEWFPGLDLLGRPLNDSDPRQVVRGFLDLDRRVTRAPAPLQNDEEYSEGQVAQSDEDEEGEKLPAWRVWSVASDVAEEATATHISDSASTSTISEGEL